MNNIVKIQRSYFLFFLSFALLMLKIVVENNLFLLQLIKENDKNGPRPNGASQVWTEY